MSDLAKYHKSLEDAANRLLDAVWDGGDEPSATDIEHIACFVLATLDPSMPNAAEIMGHRGGLKGGKARAASLTPERRSEIARLAANKRWAKP